MGQAAFLAKCGSGEARSYVVVHEGREYDSKASAGVAHQWDQGRAEAARLIRQGIVTGELQSLAPSEDEESDDCSAPEGRLLMRRPWGTAGFHRAEACS